VAGPRTAQARFHRTLKAARFDLFEGASTAEPLAGDLFVNPNHGAEYMALTFDAIWSRLAPHVFEFLDRVRTPQRPCSPLHACKPEAPTRAARRLA
jgi:hypothetical protein